MLKTCGTPGIKHKALSPLMVQCIFYDKESKYAKSDKNTFYFVLETYPAVIRAYSVIRALYAGITSGRVQGTIECSD